uniref:Cation channel sperm-associated targeting subunit tau C2 domain-containing protein n=1 Tax=Canis lupus dingo TaxID=286419 RepID=A0A8C0QUM6_CANLU
MLRRTLKGTESKELEITPEVPTLVPFGGVVFALQHYSNLFIRISINNIVKCTKMCSLPSQNNEKNAVINFDDVKYFSVQVPRRQDDVRNNIFLELMQYDKIEKYPLLLGSIQVHLYEVIQVCIQIIFTTLLSRYPVLLKYAYHFLQLKPLQKIIEPSMFMNIAPPPERIDPVINVITPQPIEYPAFLSPDLNVTIGMPPAVSQSNQPPVVRLEKLQQQPRERLEKMKKEYRNLNTWMEKASYLEGLLTPKFAHKERKVINILHISRIVGSNSSSFFNVFRNYQTVFHSGYTILHPTSNKDLILPPLNESNQDNSDAVSTKQTDESTKQTPLPVVPVLTITEENKTLPLEEYQSKAPPEGKMKNMFPPPEVKLKDRYPSLLKTDSSPSEVKMKTSFIYPGKIKRRNLDSSPTEYCWQSNNLSLARRKSTSLVSPGSESKGRSQSQDPEEHLELKVAALVLEV